MSVTRKHSGPRMSQIVVHGDTVYLAGQVALDAPGASVADQTRDILQRIDQFLAEAGSSKSKALAATIWLADMDTFNEMNEVWDAWIDADNPPARACVEARLAAPQFTVEIMVTAAV
ncbi:MAG: RidA family protein [Gammaproteobacteria bacterium]|nr:RidA family protein [Gammaproteobacteria bacterium]NIM72767.1 RidA family protein [Gammaproteobacteria bacterium]NIN38224.1 RidA family protein [Gammaproteobacteria bacterium]NIO24515.1 RidA family protein [Gammaproteobacteria bacterium]NIO65124.1 RidA family protein [Gammaproteobacteria bacterium]